MTAKAKAKARPAGHSHTVTHGSTRITTTHSRGDTTVTKSTKKGDHRTVVTTVRRAGKVISTSTHRYLIGKAAPKAKAPAKKTAAKKAPAKRGAPGLCAEGFWVTAGNDRLDTCVAVAVANSCLAVTGLRVPDWQVLALAGVRSIPDVLAGLGVPFRATEGLADGVILGVAGAHAVTVHDGALVSWGAEYPLDGLGAVEEAWEVGWR
jgi:hypothetical protein